MSERRWRAVVSFHETGIGEVGAYIGFLESEVVGSHGDEVVLRTPTGRFEKMDPERDRASLAEAKADASAEVERVIARLSIQLEELRGGTQEDNAMSYGRQCGFRD